MNDSAPPKEPQDNNNDVQAAGQDDLPEVTLNDLPQHMQDAVAKAGWTELMPVQRRSIPYLVKSRDVMVQSRTGSGKTGAFLLPTLERIDPNLKACQALVLAPTRELAKQVAKEAEILTGGSEILAAPVYGGVAYGPQIEAFEKGAQIVVGTPGRILDHILKNTLKLEHLRILVLDEADHMLSMGFFPDMRRLKGLLPKRHINCAMFSATFPPFVIKLAGMFLRDPATLSLSRDNVHVTEITHLFFEVPPMKKDRSLVRVIEMENPAQAIIFCNTKASVHFVSKVLKRFGYDADEISSDLSQSAREKVLGRVRAGKLRFLVATDVAARGIDIPDVSHVFHYDFPEDPESYVHRSGRTGRAGASGEAVSLVDVSEKFKLKKLAESQNLNLEERPLPTEEQLADEVAQRATAMLEGKIRNLDKLQAERLQRFVPLARELGQSEDELPLLAMLLDEYYQEQRHAPLAPPEPSPSSGGGSGGGGGGGRRKDGGGRRREGGRSGGRRR